MKAVPRPTITLFCSTFQNSSVLQGLTHGPEGQRAGLEELGKLAEVGAGLQSGDQQCADGQYDGEQEVRPRRRSRLASATLRSGTRRARTPLPLTVVYCFFATVRCWTKTTIISSTVSTTAMAAAAFCRDGEAFISR